MLKLSTLRTTFLLSLVFFAEISRCFAHSVKEVACEKPHQHGIAVTDSTRPAHFPHRIWAACDFEGQTPDYGWVGPVEIKNIPQYPGNATALSAHPKSGGNSFALKTGINPVPGPMMGKVNKLYLRYQPVEKLICSHLPAG